MDKERRNTASKTLESAEKVHITVLVDNIIGQSSEKFRLE